MFLTEIVKKKKEELRKIKNRKYQDDLASRIVRRAETEKPRPFASALASRKNFPTKAKIRLIAEVKKASPSKGVIREDFNPSQLAAIYESCGATAISVLTESFFFKGSLADLEAVRNRVSLPLLRKDFIIDDMQILEARAYGADAVLLIASLLDKNQIREYQQIAVECGLAA